ncbi:MAG: TerD family protein [Alphaproteobacteria bacterium]
MSVEKVKIDIPNTTAGRIYAGLSWEDIFDEKTSKSLSQADVNKAIRQTLPPQKIALLIFFALIFGQLLYLQAVMYEPTINGNLTALIVSFILSATLIFAYYTSPATLMQSSKKETDIPERDNTYQGFDIDLHCYIFNKNKEFLFEINPTSEKLINPDGKTTVYHSGEDIDGIGAYDDETIHIETKNIKSDYCHFIFAVTNDCKHEFDKINKLKIRLANSENEETYIDTNINSNEGDGFIFCHVQKEDNKLWHVTPIHKYIKFDDNILNEIKKTIHES